jgi:hypothetical protein
MSAVNISHREQLHIEELVEKLVVKSVRIPETAAATIEL